MENWSVNLRYKNEISRLLGEIVVSVKKMFTRKISRNNRENMNNVNNMLMSLI